MSVQSVNLDLNSSIDLLVKYVEVAQQKGAYLLAEADVLKRGVDVLVNKTQDKEIDANLALNLLVQGVNKGQKSGAYSLTDAALIFRVLQFLQTPQQPVAPAAPTPEADEKLDEDLASLSDPIPFKTL